MKIYSRLAIALLGLWMAGCASMAPGSDPVVVNAERVTVLALETFDGFLKWEFDNRTALAATPQVRQVADTIRRDGIAWLQSARSMTKAYKENRTPEAKANLQTALSVLDEAIKQAKAYLKKGNP